MRIGLVVLAMVGCGETRVPTYEGCADLAVAFCARIDECSGAPDAGDVIDRTCEGRELRKCCSHPRGEPELREACGARADATETEVADCLADVETQSCADIAFGFPPPSCFLLRAIGPP